VDMINDGWLSGVMFTTVRLQSTDLNKVKIAKNGDFVSSSLSRAVNTHVNNEAAVATWFDRCANRRSTIVFCVDISHINDLANTFRSHNVDARFVTGNTSNQVRANTIDAFKRGEFPVLLNCGVFTEGTDIPNIDCVILARPTKSRNLLVQMIGRGMRLSPGKENCHVIDMVTSLKTGIVTTPTLYGLDPDELVQSAEVKDLQALRERREQEKTEQWLPEQHNDEYPQELAAINMTYTDYSSINDLIEDTLGERHIRQLSMFSWVQVDEDEFVLTSPRRGFLRIRREGNGFQVRHTAKLLGASTPYSRPRDIINDAMTLEDAVHGADKFAETGLSPIVLIDNRAAWRSSPATDAQVKFLNKFRSDKEKLEPNTITKGRAQDMITKLKFGARGRFDKIAANKRRTEKELESLRKIQEMREREIVKVGPLEPNQML
jgi:ATP-dependent helicase IRC3